MTGMVQFSFQSQRRANAFPMPKECSNYHTIVIISHASKVVLKILQARLQQWSKNFQIYKLDLEKSEKSKFKLPTTAGSWEPPYSSHGKESDCNAGNLGLIPGSGRPLEKGTATHASILAWRIEKTREFLKNIYFYFIDYTKAFDCVDHNKLWKILRKFLERWEYQITLPEKPVCRSRSNSYIQRWNTQWAFLSSFLNLRKRR